MRREINGLWFVYALRDPDEPWTIRYIGCSGNAEDRLEEHIYSATSVPPKSPCEAGKGEWIRGLLAEGKSPDMDVLYVLSNKRLAYRVEKALQGLHADTIFNPRHELGETPSHELLRMVADEATETLYRAHQYMNRVQFSEAKEQNNWLELAEMVRDKAEDCESRRAFLLPANPKEPSGEQGNLPSSNR